MKLTEGIGAQVLCLIHSYYSTVKPVLSGHSKKTKKLALKTNYVKCRSKVLQNAPKEHSAIFSISNKLPFDVKTFVLYIFEWPF